jgi:hypothetical protein
MKLCSWHGCKELVDYNIKYCPLHQHEFDLSEKHRYKEYASRKRIDKEYLKHRHFYTSDAWYKARDAAISKCLGIDILEYYKTGKIVAGERVHHIIPLDKDFNKRFDVDNLFYLTERNHRRIHVLYDKSDKDYQETVHLLLELKKMFIKEFGL